MKIAILGYPRTGTNKLQRILSNFYNVPIDNDRIEWLTGLDYYQKQEAIVMLNNLSSCVVKLFIYQFNNTDVLGVDWRKFDSIFITSRESLVDSFISYSFAEKKNYWSRLVGDLFNENEEFTVDVSQIQAWWDSHIKNFDQVVSTINEIHPVHRVTYNEISNDQIILNKLSVILGQTVSTVALPKKIIPTGINYKEKCLNYTEVEEKFKELGLI